MAHLLGTGRPWTLTSTGLGLAPSMNPNRSRKRNREQGPQQQPWRQYFNDEGWFEGGGWGKAD